MENNIYELFFTQTVSSTRGAFIFATLQQGKKIQKENWEINFEQSRMQRERVGRGPEQNMARGVHAKDTYIQNNAQFTAGDNDDDDSSGPRL